MKTRLRNLFLKLRIYCTVVQIHRFDGQVDLLLNRLLDTDPALVKVDSFNAVIEYDDRCIAIWIANPYFSYGSMGYYATDAPHYLRVEKIWSDGRPKRRTMYRLAKYIRDNHIQPPSLIDGLIASTGWSVAEPPKPPNRLTGISP